MSSIKFCDQEMLERFSKIKYVSEYIYEKQKSLKDLIEQNQKDRTNKSMTILEDQWLTNIGIFRAYVTAYLQANPKISADPYFLVRQLQPTEHGLPIEIYVYCNDTAWAHYEDVQADIFDHILSVVPEFDLRVFQSPSGYDLTELQIGINRKEM
jgi:miniconductance mechanosensitive channel